MSTAQRIIVVIAALIILAMCLVPPWMEHKSGSHHAIGYSPVWKPPLQFASERVEGDRFNRIGGTYLDSRRLAIQVFAVCVLTAAITLVARRKAGPR